MKLIATIVDLLLRLAAVASLGVFGIVYVMVGFMAGPIGIIFVVLPTLALGGWILICACIPNTVASKLIGPPTLRFLLMKIPLYAIAAAGIYWKGNNLLFEHRANGPRAEQVRRGDPQFPESNPNPIHMLAVTGTLPVSLPVKDLIAVYSADSASGKDSSSACARVDEFAPLGSQMQPLVFVEHVPMLRMGDTYGASIVIDRFKAGICGWHLREINYFLSVKGYRNDEYYAGRNFFPHIRVLAPTESPESPTDRSAPYRGPIDVFCWKMTEHNVNPFYPVRCTDIKGALHSGRHVEVSLSSAELDSNGVAVVSPDSPSVEFNFHDLDAVAPPETEVRKSQSLDAEVIQNRAGTSTVARKTASAMTISVGDSFDAVQKAMGTMASPEPTHGATVTNAHSLLLADQGIRIFFDGSNKVYEIRIDAPFAGQLMGTRISQSRQAIEDALGPPTKEITVSATKTARSFIYHLDAATTARYDFDAEDKLTTIYLLSGTLQTAPGGP
jgi:hypothetical protein